MSEVRVMVDGALSLVQASASGGGASGARVWATASAPASAMNIAYVDSFSYTSARQIATQSNRGLPTHHKYTQSDPIQVSFTVRWTGQFTGLATASGATMPLAHLEFKASNPEDGGTGRFYQFQGVAFQQDQFTENADADTLQFTLVALGMNGPTGSGYLS